MSVALALMGVSTALGVVQGISRDQQLKSSRELQKFNERSAEANIKIQSASLITEQYKSFNNFMEGHSSLVASQENYLNANSYDSRGTARSEVERQQQKDFYASQQTVEENIRNIETKTELSILGNRAQMEINKAGFEQARQDNKLSTLTNFFGGATQIGMATGMFAGGTGSDIAGAIPTQTQLNQRTGVPLLGGTNNRNLA